MILVLFGSALCASEETLPQSIYTQEMVAHYEKECFLRKEKEAFATGKQSLFFCNVHAGALIFFIPSVGVGARYQKGSTGFDLSIDYNTLLFVNVLSTKGSFFYFFPHQDFDKQFYIGGGIGGGVLLSREYSSGNQGTGFVVMTLGKKMGRKTYAQFELLASRIDQTVVYLPTVKFGWGF